MKLIERCTDLLSKCFCCRLLAFLWLIRMHSVHVFGLAVLLRRHAEPRPSPLPELLEHDAVGEALSADADALQHAVTAELLQHQVGVHLAGLQQHDRQTDRQGS